MEKQQTSLGMDGWVARGRMVLMMGREGSPSFAQEMGTTLALSWRPAGWPDRDGDRSLPFCGAPHHQMRQVGRALVLLGGWSKSDMIEPPTTGAAGGKRKGPHGLSNTCRCLRAQQYSIVVFNKSGQAKGAAATKRLAGASPDPLRWTRADNSPAREERRLGWEMVILRGPGQATGSANRRGDGGQGPHVCEEVWMRFTAYSEARGARPMPLEDSAAAAACSRSFASDSCCWGPAGRSTAAAALGSRSGPSGLCCGDSGVLSSTTRLEYTGPSISAAWAGLARGAASICAPRVLGGRYVSPILGIEAGPDPGARGGAEVRGGRCPAQSTGLTSTTAEGGTSRLRYEGPWKMVGLARPPPLSPLGLASVMVGRAAVSKREDRSATLARLPGVCPVLGCWEKGLAPQAAEPGVFMEPQAMQSMLRRPPRWW